MTMWELAACVDGVNASRGAEPQPEIGQDEYRAMLDRNAQWIAAGQAGTLH